MMSGILTSAKQKIYLTKNPLKTEMTTQIILNENFKKYFNILTHI